jgi:hypothetical protein
LILPSSWVYKHSVSETGSLPSSVGVKEEFLLSSTPLDYLTNQIGIFSPLHQTTETDLLLFLYHGLGHAWSVRRLEGCVCPPA